MGNCSEREKVLKFPLYLYCGAEEREVEVRDECGSGKIVAGFLGNYDSPFSALRSWCSKPRAGKNTLKTAINVRGNGSAVIWSGTYSIPNFRHFYRVSGNLSASSITN